jgi:hypothetical protein
MADQRKEIRRFLRAARQRLDTALFLLKHQFNLLDAMYLAGYAVEMRTEVADSSMDLQK